MSCSPPVISGRRPPDPAAPGDPHRQNTTYKPSRKEAHMKPLRWLVAAAIAVDRADRGGLQFMQLGSSPRREIKHSRGEQHGLAAACTSAIRHPQESDRYPRPFGMINDETGAVTFPEARQGSIAAVDYVNNYLDGINGHPIQIDSCIGDGTPATAARVRQPAGGRPPDRDPGRGRRRRPRLDPHLRPTPTWPTWAASRSPRSRRPPPTRSSSGRSASATTPPPPSTRARSSASPASPSSTSATPRASRSCRRSPRP